MSDESLHKQLTAIAAQPGPRPARLGQAAYHGLAGAFLRLMAPYSEAGDAAQLLHFLVMFGNAAGRGSAWRVGGVRHGTNLNAVAVGDTSGGRKGTALADARRVMQFADPDWTDSNIRSGLSSGEGLIHHVRDARVERRKAKNTGERQEADEEGRIEVEEDPGVEDKRICVVETEFARTLRVMRKESSTLSHVLRDFWDHGNAGTLTKGDPTRATDAHVSCFGHITPIELQKELQQVDLFNGFGNRFLWAWSERSKALPFAPSPPEYELIALGREIAKAIAFAREERDLAMTRTAEARWREIYEPLGADLPGTLGVVTARAVPQVLRLAVIYAVLGHHEQIDLVHLEAALEVWRYCFESAAHIFGGSLGDALAEKLLVALKEAGPAGLSLEQLHDGPGKHKSAAERERALSLLDAHGLAVMRTEPGPGRYAKRWFVTEKAPAHGRDGRNGQEATLPDLSDLSVQVREVRSRTADTEPQSAASGHLEGGQGESPSKPAQQAESETEPQQGASLWGGGDPPPCPYKEHRWSDWTGTQGRTICGVCHPSMGVDVREPHWVTADNRAIAQLADEEPWT